MDIIINTSNGSLLVSYKGKRYNIKSFYHPIQKKELFMFQSSKPILNTTYPLHGVLSKTKKYANIFDEDMQIKIADKL